MGSSSATTCCGSCPKESQVPDLINPTSERYEDSIVQDLIPAIEDTILQGHVWQ